MAVHIPDFVRVTIDGTDRTAYIISYSRHSTLCAFSDTFTLELSFEIPTIPDPYDSILIRELYDGENEKVIGGYIIDVTQNFDTGIYTISGQDKTLLLEDYFIHTQTLANNETAAYWMNYYAGLVGLSVQYDSSVTQFIVEEGTPMGMITAADGISLLERLAAVYIKYDAEIDKLRVFRITSSEPVIQITNNETTRFDRERGTDKTRNVVKVYGAHRYNIFTGEATQVTAKAVTNLSELITDKTAVVANPHVRRTSTAELIATRVLQIIDDVDDVLNIETAGFYPQVEVGEYIGLNIGALTFGYSADREVTSIQTTIDDNGAVTIFTVGEKCPRVSIMPPTTAVYATATRAGVLVSYNAGEGFEPFNRGIVSQSESDVGPSGINGLSVAVNKYGQLMAIVDNTLYNRVGKYGSWTDLSAFLSGPSNDEGEHQFSVTDLQLEKVEKESNAWGKFHFLAKVTSSGGIVPSGQERWWAYWTPDFGYSWDSMQLYVPGSGIGIGASGGIPAGLTNGIGITHAQMQAAAALSGTMIFNVDAKDIEGGKAGDVTVLVQGEPKFFIPEDTGPAETYYAGNIHVSETPGTVGHSFISGLTWYMDGYDLDNFASENQWFGNTGFIETNAFNIVAPIALDTAVFSIPNNRKYAYYLTANGVVHQSQILRTRGQYLNNPFAPPDESDVPAWEYLSSATTLMGGANPVEFFGFLDYSSLKGSSSEVRFAIAWAIPGPGSTGGDTWASTADVTVFVEFFTDDVSADPSVSCTYTQDSITIGHPGGFPSPPAPDPSEYEGEGLFGYTAHASTGSPVPRSSQWGGGVGETAKYGSSSGAMTRSKTGTNYGYIVVKCDDSGSWHGDDRDEGWDDDPPVRHPRDYDEFESVGVFVVKINLTTQEIESVTGKNIPFAEYHDPPPDPEQPQRDIDLLAYKTEAVTIQHMMQTPNESWHRHTWDGHGGEYWFWVSYPGLSVTAIDKEGDLPVSSTFLTRPKGVLKVPFYTGTMQSEVHDFREEDLGPPPSWVGSTAFYRRKSGSWTLVDEPPVNASGEIVIVRQHPDYGICVNEMRAQASGRGSIFDEDITRWDYEFMWKAERANATTYNVQGSYNSDGLINPYDSGTWVGGEPPLGRTNESQFRWKPLSWDFRTEFGSTSMADGGSSGIWNFLD
jgi:hypothetical protein